MAELKQNIKDIANETAKQRKEERFKIIEKREVNIPKMPAWKINALNQVGEDTLQQVLNKLENQNRVMVVRPTGFGKSYMLAGLTSCGKFKNCLYIYPTKVIKSDMLDTYGIHGEDSRSGMLKNTTFITYHMLGQLVRAINLSVDKSLLTSEYIEEMDIDTKLDNDSDIEEDTSTGRKITIKRLGNEENVYDTSSISWYNSLLKDKKSKIDNIKQLLKSDEQKITELENELNSLIAKKSKAIKKINSLQSSISILNNNIKSYKSKINKYNNKSKSVNTEDKDEKNIQISSKEDLSAWLSQFDLILIDEAHKTGSYSFVSLWQGILNDLVVNNGAKHTIKMVGATATPYRLDGKCLEQYIFGENCRLKNIDINDCIKPNNWDYLGIDINKILEDDTVIDEETTVEYLQSRGLFKQIDYVYAIHNLDDFTNNAIEFIAKHRQSGNAITEDNKDKLISMIKSDRAYKLLEERKFNKLTPQERKVWVATNTQVAKEIKNLVSKDITQSDKDYALERCNIIKNEDTRNIFIRRVNYTLTVEDMQYIISEIRDISDVDTKILQIINKEENYLQQSEKNYIQSKIEEIPRIPELLQSTISERNTYGLNYMKFIIFFASSTELNTYIARDRQSMTIIGRWFKEAFPGYNIFEASLHTGKGTQGVAKIKTEELGKLKPTDKVIDLIYCVDQLNMGYHIENITGVILLRNTESASVYNQQIGRCCSVRAENNTIMIDIIDKKPINEIMEKVSTQFDFGLDKDGKQKDLKYLLEPECINVCDLTQTIVSLIDNMRDMQFNQRETVRFLYMERKAPIEAIVHMTGYKKSLVNELLIEIKSEQKQLDKIKNHDKLEY